MFKMKFLCGVAVTTVLTGAGAVAQGAADLLVVNQGDRSLSVVDAAAGKVLSAVPVGGVTGHEVAVTPDGRTAFVPVYGSSGVGKPGTDGQQMAVVDVPSHTVRGTVDFGHGVRPHCAVYDAKRGVLYVTTELDKSVAVVDPRTLKVVGSIPTGQTESHMLALSHDGRHGYTANVGPGTVSVLDLEGRKTAAVIPVAGNVQRIAVSNDDRMVFTADQGQPRMAVIDTATNKVSRWIGLPGIGYGAATTKDGRYLLVALRETGKLAVVDLKTLTTVRTIDLGKGPVEVLVRPDGRVAYVSCSPDAAVAELAIAGDVAGWHVARMIPAGAGADGLAWAGR
ncbi:MAG: hypothetical protein NVSMB3_00060 [Acidobacteriaceae bacterium]